MNYQNQTRAFKGASEVEESKGGWRGLLPLFLGQGSWEDVDFHEQEGNNMKHVR